MKRSINLEKPKKMKSGENPIKEKEDIEYENTNPKIRTIKSKTRKIKPLEIPIIEGQNNDEITNPNSKTRKVKIYKKVQTLFNKPESVRQAKYLKNVCSDSGECVIFGLERERIQKFFDNFKLTTGLINIKQIKQLGAPSANGFVTEIPYKKENYKAYAVLKSAIDKDSDNLYYEALVGLYLNKKGLIHPCFLDTYNIFYYNNTHTYNSFRDKKITDSGLLNNINPLLDKYNYENMFSEEKISKSCIDSKYLCILIQHLKNADTLYEYMKKYKAEENFFTVFLVNILFQVYCPLSSLSDEFTHYDLHAGNVLIYQPSAMNKRHVKMIYHYPDDSIVEFNTYGIAKIIDYGRSYFKDEKQNVDSQSFHKNLCKSKKCEHCGHDNGYSVLQKEDYPGSFYHISSHTRNQSHDLRLANSIYNTPGKFSGTSSKHFRELLSKVTYEDNFGTPEKLGYNYYQTGTIKNVNDMHFALKDFILNQEHFKEKNDILFQNSAQMGEIHTWVDGSKPMQYIFTLLRN